MLEKSIIKLGLSDKESKVYLASLELGPSTAQIISNKSNVNRATTYVVIESLMKMGLMSTYDEGKKTFFIASPPEQLMKYLKNRENEVTEKINTLNDIMSQLNFLAEIGQNQWKIKSYEGEGEDVIEKAKKDFFDRADSIHTFKGEVGVSKNKIFLVDYHEKSRSFIIENNALAKTLSSLIETIEKIKTTEMLARDNNPDKVSNS